MMFEAFTEEDEGRAVCETPTGITIPERTPGFYEVSGEGNCDIESASAHFPIVNIR